MNPATAAIPDRSSDRCRLSEARWPDAPRQLRRALGADRPDRDVPIGSDPDGLAQATLLSFDQPWKTPTCAPHTSS
jgi:hypothetical protein